ncbi:protein kinase domain-containing protein [Streptomyces alboflavus]|uniref:serine/threonine-protein kinase n=1 Tax=Streptomyces alboflavus TaxID=67267 RepID=UPI0004BEEF0B|nr:serine/threonine-protein kinase [Streptomyces alboflavus]
MTSPLLSEDPRTLGGHRLLSRLGAGGMGQVYLARSPGGRLLAVKTVHEHLAADAKFRERFRREATAARAVTGAHTAAVVDADPDADQPWLATAYLPGVTLRQAVAAGGPLTGEAVRALAAALAEALACIHAAGIVHRDLKPSNVLVTADGPRVIDFGIARATGEPAKDGPLTATGSMLGTPGYMAPEQILGGPTGPATDVFALGAVLTFAATGAGPFGAGPVAVLLYRAAHEDPDLTGVPEAAGLRALVASCLRRDPSGRPAVGEVLRRTARHDGPLWWRDEPLRSLVADAVAPEGPEGDVASEETATRPAAESATRPTADAGPPTRVATTAPPPAPDTTPEPAPKPAPDRAPEPSPDPAPPPTAENRPAPDRALRRRALARRSALTVAGGGLAALMGWAISTAPPGSRPRDPAEQSALSLREGKRAPGATRWTLTLDDAVGGSLDALLLAGDTVLVRGPKRGTTLGGGAVHAVRAADGSERWRRDGGTQSGPALWGVTDGLLIAPDVLAEVVDVRTGKPWPVKNAWPSPGTTRWFAVAAGRLVTLHVTGSSNDPELRLRTLPGGTAPSVREDVPAWLPPAVSGSSLLLAPEPADLTEGASCVDARTGELRWTHRHLTGDERAVAAPVTLPQKGSVGARFALLTEESELHLVDVGDGERPARRHLDLAAGRGTTAVGQAAGVGLVLGGGRIEGFDPRGGGRLWSHASAGLDASWPRRAGGARGPVTAGGVLVHWTDTNTLAAVDVRDGRKPLWTASFGATGQRPPAIGGDTVYVTAGREVRALGLRDGRRRARWRLDGTATALTADADGWYAIVGGTSARAVNAAAR